MIRSITQQMGHARKETYIQVKAQLDAQDRRADQTIFHIIHMHMKQ